MQEEFHAGRRLRRRRIAVAHIDLAESLLVGLAFSFDTEFDVQPFTLIIARQFESSGLFPESVVPSTASQVRISMRYVWIRARSPLLKASSQACSVCPAGVSGMLTV